MKIIQITIAAFLLLAGFSIVQAQRCGGWSVEVEIVDGGNHPVKNPGLELINVPEGDSGRGLKFLPAAKDSNILKGIFSEGGNYSLKYEARIFSPGYEEKIVLLPIYFCHSSSNKFHLKPITRASVSNKRQEVQKLITDACMRSKFSGVVLAARLAKPTALCEQGIVIRDSKKLNGII